jgi:hypothetical protein
LARVVVDRLTRALTNLVVEPADRHAAGRLVAIALVAEARAGVRLHCTMAEFQWPRRSGSRLQLPRSARPAVQPNGGTGR